MKKRSCIIATLFAAAMLFGTAEPAAAQSSTKNQKKSDSKKTLIVFYSWGGTTQGIARKIQQKLGCDMFEIELVKPYSTDYNTVLDEAQRDQRNQARPAIKNKVADFAKYDTIVLGYPNWWASIPMPIATFLESYDFDGKTVIPFCSNGGGRLGQSVSAITKLVPGASVKNPLSIYYSGGASLDSDLNKWLSKNGF
ncbi:flavodoxin [Treponema brennaborense]|uniref:Flavodoxin-like domain-containing protein n=1 Tax=Treponema brennaborense (strain DSM 12168 / CIP 105900 / DD5/3) TaxID=906968 RepID=F4LLW8_TREBD|nr:flavodoxin [Treponema brennaborense]AEE15660.1 protein of unknown function DUF323 [Treponema brennaborense DSM 12168]